MKEPGDTLDEVESRLLRRAINRRDRATRERREAIEEIRRILEMAGVPDDAAIVEDEEGRLVVSEPQPEAGANGRPPEVDESGVAPEAATEGAEE